MDSETYRVDPKNMDEESARRPLPDRFRNSVAHELVHSLVFRQSEFGLRLRQGVKDVDIDDIEHATEALSPLVLIPENDLSQRVHSLKGPMSVKDLMAWRRDWGVSRYVLLSRLGRLSRDHPLRQLQGLRNCAAGIATWDPSGEPVLLGWPLYVNFDRNVQPRFLIALAAREKIPATLLNSGVALTAGHEATVQVTWETPAGVIGSEANEPLAVTLTLEPSRNRSGGRYFWVISKA